VVFSSKQIPGNELTIGDVINTLISQGVEVITEKDAHVHVSGHPGQPELKAMYGWIKPEIAVPVHGEIRHMTKQAQLAKRWGAKKTLVPRNGSIIRLAPGEPEVIGEAPVGRLVLDGDMIVGADSNTMVVRRRLQHNGYLSATLVIARGGQLAADPVIVMQGLPIEREADQFLEDCQSACTKALNQTGAKNRERLAEQARIAIRRVAREYTAKRPVTDVNIIQL
jgi:ribonuclease J